MANIYDMSDTWNDAGTTFTAIKMDVTDTASDASSLLMDLQVGGSSKFKFAKDGSFFVNTNNIGNAIYVNNAGRNVSFATSLSITTSGATPRFITVGSSAAFSRIPLGGLDLYLERDAADTLAQRRSTNAQTFNLYNTYTDASNYERGFMRWNNNVLQIGTEAAGTGTVRTLLLPSVIKIGSFTLSTLGTDRLLNGFNWGYTASIGTGGLVNSSGSQVRWSSGPTYAAIDAGLSRDSAGVIKVTDGSTGTGDLIANQVLLGTNSAPAVKSDTTQAGTNSVAANNIVTISQADYDALTPDPDTIYFIV